MSIGLWGGILSNALLHRYIKTLSCTQICSIVNFGIYVGIQPTPSDLYIATREILTTVLSSQGFTEIFEDVVLGEIFSY